MQKIIEKTLLFLLCFIILLMHYDTTACVVAGLCTIIASSLSYYTDKGRTSMCIAGTVSLLTLIFPGIAVFFPVICYDCADQKLSRMQKMISYIVLVSVFSCSTRDLPEPFFIFLCILAVFAALTCIRTQKIDILQKTILKNRDSDRELQLLLEEKNRNLIEKSHYEIETATLRERNRIAREIHDNVGHLLTRSILQVGALKTINKNEALTPQYEQLSNTLNHAMDTIRSSVHNLYTPGVDFKTAIEGFIETIKKPKIHLHYEANQLPQTITYHFIAIIKEAVNNTIRHSNADTIQISLLEHPRFYQLIIEDNGTGIDKDFDPDNNNFSGMGLSSMQERVFSLHGTMKIFTTKGFKIFITVMKKEN